MCEALSLSLLFMRGKIVEWREKMVFLLLLVCLCVDLKEGERERERRKRTSTRFGAARRDEEDDVGAT